MEQLIYIDEDGFTGEVNKYLSDGYYIVQIVPHNTSKGFLIWLRKESKELSF